MVRLLALVVLFHGGSSDADNAVAVGGTAGVTLGLSPYFPSYFIGAAGTIHRTAAGPLSIGLVARIQLYYGPEEEDYGSWGFQQDLSVALRLNAFWGDHGSHCVNPFLSVHAGLAAVELVPFRDSASNELIGGYLLGGSAGVDIGGDRERPPTQLQISFDIPSFGTNQGAAAPVGELSLALLAARRW